MLEATQHLIGSLDDMPGYVAFVGHAHIAHGVAAYKAIAAHEAELCPVPNYVPWHPGSGEY
jgi:hypothetical protein